MEPRRGTECAALFDDGNGPAWYRAKVLGATPVGTRVRYVDHGNCATVKANKLRSLDSSYFAFSPQAKWVFYEVCAFSGWGGQCWCVVCFV